MLGILCKLALILLGILVLLFIIYFFNLDMKLIVNVIAPFLERHYDKRDKNQYL